ncbi:hypothetical protein LCGC14_2562190, partial [marine sediment metagenome]
TANKLGTLAENLKDELGASDTGNGKAKKQKKKEKKNGKSKPIRKEETQEELIINKIL